MQPKIVGEFRVERGSDAISLADRNDMVAVRGQDFDFGASFRYDRGTNENAGHAFV
jgi:hypothetical protein